MIDTSFPLKLCEFLRTGNEIDFCNRYLRERNAICHPIACKNWELCHILPQLSDGNILEVGGPASFVLANALRQAFRGEKVGIDVSPLPLIIGATILHADITDTDFPSRYFQTITTMTALGSSVDLPRFTTEVSRLLKRGGLLITSFDYWPASSRSRDESSQKGRKILSREDVVQFLDAARQVGLEPIAEIDWSIDEPVNCPEYRPADSPKYTFGTLQFRKMYDVKPARPKTAPNNNKVLIINSTQPACGVYQFGSNISKILSANQHRYEFHTVDCASADEVMYAFAQHNPSAVLFNYYLSTQEFVDRELVYKLGVCCIGIYHEISADVLGAPVSPSPFDYWIHSDPSLPSSGPWFWNVGRPLFKYENRFPQPQVPTIGTFGFGFTGKGYTELAKMVQDQFERATLRMHIPFSHYNDPRGDRARLRLDEVRAAIKSPNIQLEVTHHLMSPSDLLDFLAQNSLNAFLYDPVRKTGISSVIDYALSVDRPIAISTSPMFRHIASASPSIIAGEMNPLPQIISNGARPLQPFKSAWTHERLIEQFQGALDQIMDLYRSETDQ
ncbi:MAG: class I SAM-dependent methyltransferase [Planctomycetota bacterium]|nr:class I SAM-dependent methyltransferase [Planctomycetota bacterium]